MFASHDNFIKIKHFIISYIQMLLKRTPLWKGYMISKGKSFNVSTLYKIVWWKCTLSLWPVKIYWLYHVYIYIGDTRCVFKLYIYVNVWKYDCLPGFYIYAYLYTKCACTRQGFHLFFYVSRFKFVQNKEVKLHCPCANFRCRHPCLKPI